MNYLEIINLWEQKTKAHFQIELLELLYQPYSFGCGESVYRIKGRNVRFFFDGREKMIEIKISGKHERFPNCSWKSIGEFKSEEFLLNGIEILKSNIND